MPCLNRGHIGTYLSANSLRFSKIFQDTTAECPISLYLASSNEILENIRVRSNRVTQRLSNYIRYHSICQGDYQRLFEYFRAAENN